MFPRRFWVYPLTSIACLLVIWYVTALFLDARLLPNPIAVIRFLGNEIQSGRLLHHLGATLTRLTISFIIAMLLGIAIGIALGRREKLDRFFDQWLIIFLNIPALVTIILCYIWFGLVETAAIAAVVINKLPNVVVTIREGTRALDRDLFEMAQSYRFNRIKTVMHVILPQLYPFIVAAARSGLALIWKIVLVVELLGRSDGMGYQLHLFFQMFDVAGILAYTIAFILVIQIIEFFILKPFDRFSTRWRR